MNDLPKDERDVIVAVLDAAAARGLLVAVHDGEEWACGPVAAPYGNARAVIGATGETRLRFRDPAALPDGHGKPGRVGDLWLVHGNGADVLSDWSDNPAMAALVAPALTVADLVQ